MRLISLFAAATLAVVASSAFAQTDTSPEAVEAATATIEGAELSDTLYQNLWCGAAMTLVEAKGREAGDTASADQIVPIKDALYTAAAEEAVAAGIPEADFSAVSMAFVTVAAASLNAGEEPEYALEDCSAPAVAQ